jgi:hypothetical protein
MSKFYLFDIFLCYLLVAAFFAWSAHPRACCPHPDPAQNVMTACSGHACCVVSAMESDSDAAGPSGQAYNGRDTMPRQTESPSEPPSLMLSGKRILDYCSRDVTDLPPLPKKPEAPFQALPKKPPRL